MVQTLRRSWFALVAALSLIVTTAVLTGQSTGLTRVAYADPAGIKYTGAGACSAAACHGAAAPKNAKATQHNENTAWSSKDHHAHAFTGKKGLASPAAKKIADAMKIADATKEGKCQICHVISEIKFKDGSTHRVPLKADQLGAKFNLEDGVSCDACHGPASKYLEPHTTAGWTAGQRAQGPAKLYDEWGLLDTKNLKFRANICLSCHLKIDAEMVAAGHPELPFELNMYSLGEDANGFYAGKHWRDNEAWFSTKAWAMGQVVSLREAAAQVGERTAAKADAAHIEASTKKMWAHAILARQVAKAVDAGSLAAIDAGLKGNDTKATAAAAEALADKVNAFKFDQASTEAMLKAVAAEGEQAGNVGYAGAEQFVWSLKSLLGVMQHDGKQDVAKKMEKVDALYEPMADSATYKPEPFVAAAKAIVAEFPGGASIPKP